MQPRQCSRCGVRQTRAVTTNMNKDGTFLSLRFTDMADSSVCWFVCLSVGCFLVCMSVCSDAYGGAMNAGVAVAALAVSFAATAL